MSMLGSLRFEETKIWTFASLPALPAGDADWDEAGEEDRGHDEGDAHAGRGDNIF